MRTHRVSLIVSLLLLGALSFATAGGRTAKQCEEIGFKPASKAFGDCVAELDARESKQLSVQGVQCADIGFLPMTEAFDSCVQTLKSRQDHEISPVVTGTPRVSPSADEATCRTYGFATGTLEFSRCKQAIFQAKVEAAQRQAQYELDLKRYEVEKQAYEQRLAQYEEQKREEEKQRRLRFGLSLLSGTAPSFLENVNNAHREMLGLPPQAPSQPSFRNFTITSPKGNTVDCQVFGSVVQCH